MKCALVVLLHVLSACAIYKVIVPAVHNEFEGIGLPDWMVNQTLQKELDYEVFLYQKMHSDQPNYLRNRGTEGGVYLKYIVDHYDNFPDIAMFVHAHPHEHQPYFLDLIHCVSPMATYLSINTDRGCRQTAAWGPLQMWVEQCWRDALRIVWNMTSTNDTEKFNSIVPTSGPIQVCMYYSNQFILSRDQMRRRPLNVWKDLLRIVNEQDQCHQGAPDYQNLYANDSPLKEEPVDITAELFGGGTTELPFKRLDKPGGGYGRLIQGGMMEHLSHVIFGFHNLDMEYPQQRDRCQNFIPFCPRSLCNI